MNNTVKNRWKVYIAAHDRLVDNFLSVDPGFNRENYEILNVGPNDHIKRMIDIYELDQKKLKTFTSLGKWWAESEGIYNLWKSGIYRDLDYIGFIHYDLELKLRDGFHLRSSNISERINKILQASKDSVHISFETHDIKTDYNQKILADFDKPNILQGEGRNCYDYILAEYNDFFKTNHSIDELMTKSGINLCSCFFVDIAHFEEMMNFFEWVINKKELDLLDTEHKNRLQGGLAERFFGVYLAFAYSNMHDLSLIHHWNSGLKEQESIYCRVERNDINVGLASLFNTNLGAIDHLNKQGYRVVIDRQGDHRWSDLFNTAGLPDNTEYESYNSVVSFRPDDSMEILCNKRVMDYWHNIYLENCSIKDEIVNEANTIIKQTIGDELDKTIGVLCRGTDYLTIRPQGHPRQPKPSDLFGWIDDKVAEGYKYVYLVTEDNAVLEEFKSKYGERLIISPQDRIEPAGREYLAEAVKRQRIDIYKRDRDYLIAIYILSLCGVLVAGRTSGTVMAMVISEGYKDVKLYNNGRYGDEMEEQLKYEY